MKKISLFLIFAAYGLGQSTGPTSIPLGEPALPVVFTINPVYTGAAPVGGNSAQYCYWIVARFAVGNAAISNPACVQVNPVGGGNVVVSWTPPGFNNINSPTYTLTYDVLRTTGVAMNQPCANCVLASATSSLTATDTLGTLSSGYTFSTYTPSTLTFQVDNTSTDRAIAYNITATGAKRQADIRHGTSLPTDCNAGDLFLVTGGGGALNICLVTNVWTSLGGSAGVTSVTGTSPVVSSGGSTPAISISGVTGEQGNGAKLQLSTGSTTTNDCVKFDANGNTIDAGAGCGSGGGNTVNTVASSATPAFNLSLGNIQYIAALATNATMTVSNLVAGKWTFIVCLDGTGSETFTWSAAFHGAMVIGITASKCNVQSFTSPDGTNLYADSTGVINQ